MQSLLIEKAIEVCKDQPGVLFSPDFTDAVKIMRQNPELWADYRVKIKRAKPAGVLLSDIDDATRPEGDFDDGGDGVASALIKLVVDSGELFFDDQADSSFVTVIMIA